jgi:NH3-dependent NAD+ synthetase
LTKYDCSSADLNPIGGISKVDLRNFIDYFSRGNGFGFLKKFLDAPPTAELEPRTKDYEQTDEVLLSEVGGYGYVLQRLIRIWYSSESLQIGPAVHVQATIGRLGA